MEESVHVLIVSPKSLLTELLVATFSSSSSIHVAGHATTEAQVTAALESEQIDVVLLDGEMNGSERGEMEVLRLLRRNVPRVKPVVLLQDRDRRHVVQCFRHGARGIFLKESSDFNLLCKCIHCVNGGEIWASSEELGWIVDALWTPSVREMGAPRGGNALGQHLLSKRQEDVVALLRDGLSNKEIAQTLNLSEHTIKNYLFRIFDKLGVSSRTELLLYAMKIKMNEMPLSNDSVEAEI